VSPVVVGTEVQAAAAWPNSAPGGYGAPGTGLKAGRAATERRERYAPGRFWLGPRAVGERASQKHGVAVPAVRAGRAGAVRRACAEREPSRATVEDDAGPPWPAEHLERLSESGPCVGPDRWRSADCGGPPRRRCLALLLEASAVRCPARRRPASCTSRGPRSIGRVAHVAAVIAVRGQNIVGTLGVTTTGDLMDLGLATRRCWP
jgi:hypothetical protein